MDNVPGPQPQVAMPNPVAVIKADIVKVEAAPVKVETKAISWIEKHPNYTAMIAVVAVLAILYAVVKAL